ncbi:hypothetical protein Q9233_011654 [Columba guinea]|nr:hypothetical protein Q9233_011654 [Columba guinea]
MEEQFLANWQNFYRLERRRCKYGGVPAVEDPYLKKLWKRC